MRNFFVDCVKCTKSTNSGGGIAFSLSDLHKKSHSIAIFKNRTYIYYKA